jgi:hypothetical protein
LGAFTVGRGMRADVRARVGLVVALVVLGATLGAVGSALGVGGPVTDDPAAEFVVGEENVSLENGGERATVLADGGPFETVEIRRENGGFVVRTDDADALNDSQRERAKRLARANDTVAAHLASLDEYELAVEPVAVITASDAVTLDADFGGGNATETEAEPVTVNVTVSESSADSVTVERETTYSDDTAVVVVREPGSDDRDYTVKVDLANETVAHVHDRTRDGE